MIQEAAVLAIAALLSLAAWQDVKTREIDIWLFVAMAPPAAVLLYLNWGDLMYFFSLLVGLGVAFLMRILCAGYADSIAMAVISTAPPIYMFPTAFVAIMAGSTLLPAVMTWLYLENRERPCEMSLLERFTHLCVSREEFYSDIRYIHRTASLCIPYRHNPGDLERYDPRAVKIEGEWVKAAYGMPYLAILAAGFAIYTAIMLLA
ncbi:MAG: prepilin peptidase [Pyrobaculum sp.]